MTSSGPKKAIADDQISEQKRLHFEVTNLNAFSKGDSRSTQGFADQHAHTDTIVKGQCHVQVEFNSSHIIHSGGPMIITQRGIHLIEETTKSINQSQRCVVN